MLKNIKLKLNVNTNSGLKYQRIGIISNFTAHHQIQYVLNDIFNLAQLITNHNPKNSMDLNGIELMLMLFPCSYSN